jgi:hypothetical protein
LIAFLQELLQAGIDAALGGQERKGACEREMGEGESRSKVKMRREGHDGDKKTVASAAIFATRYLTMVTGMIVAALFLVGGFVAFLYLQKGKM